MIEGKNMDIIKLNDMSDYDLAHTLNEWIGDASGRWDDFSETEKNNFRLMQDEACKRFIRSQGIEDHA